MSSWLANDSQASDQLSGAGRGVLKLMLRCIHACMLIKQMTFAGDREHTHCSRTTAHQNRGCRTLLCWPGCPWQSFPAHSRSCPLRGSSRASFYCSFTVLRSRSRDFSICAMLVLDVLPCHRVQENAQMSSAKHYIRHLLTSNVRKTVLYRLIDLECCKRAGDDVHAGALLRSGRRPTCERTAGVSVHHHGLVVHRWPSK